MALPTGLSFDNVSDIPESSRPDTPLADIGSLPAGQGSRHGARVAPDGTRWCLTCWTTFAADSRQALCVTCARERGRIRRGERRLASSVATVQVPRAAIEQLVRHTRRLEMGIGQVLAAVETGQSADGPGRRLARASKEVSVLVDNEYRPRVAPLRSDARR